MSQGQGGGRPLKFKSVKKLQESIDAYFRECDPHVKRVREHVFARNEEGKLLKDEYGLNYLVEVDHLIVTKQETYTITGLALALGTNRHTLIDYGDGKYDTTDEKFSHTIKEAKSKVEKYIEDHLLNGQTAGAIFNLKNNFGWRDKTEVDETSQVTVVTRKHQDDDDEEPDDDDD